MHIWHDAIETDDASAAGPDSHQCLLCTVFAHLPFLNTAGVTIPPASITCLPVALPAPKPIAAAPRLLLLVRSPPDSSL